VKSSNARKSLSTFSGKGFLLSVNDPAILGHSWEFRVMRNPPRPASRFAVSYTFAANCSGEYDIESVTDFTRKEKGASIYRATSHILAMVFTE